MPLALPSASMRNEPDMPRCMTSTVPSSRSASRILRPPPDRDDLAAGEPLGEAAREGHAQVAPPLLDLDDGGALHDRGKAAADRLDFGQFGHARVS